MVDGELVCEEVIVESIYGTKLISTNFATW